jgi:hypothetical protein
MNQQDLSLSSSSLLPPSSSLAAIMFSQLKCTPQQFRQWLLACDSVHLTGDLLAQLDKSLPTLEELKKLSDLKNEISDLPDSEQYFCAVSNAGTGKRFYFTVFSRSNRSVISNEFINELKSFSSKLNTTNYSKIQKR